MSADDLRRELRELHAFLAGNYRDTGHPYDTDADVIALEMAIDILVDGEGTQWAIAAIKSALAPRSWFRIVLREHPDNPLFLSAIELCESISEKLLLVTGDSYSASVPVVGEWQEFEDPPHGWGDALFYELAEYSQLRRQLPQYTMFVFNRLAVASADRRIPAECQVAMDRLNSMIDLLPGDTQLFAGRRKPLQPFEWIYHTSYLVFADKNNKFSRSSLLGAVREVLEELRKCKKIFTAALEDRDAVRSENEELLAALLAKYEAWKALAEKQVAKLAVGVWRKREEAGRLTHKAVRVTQLLADLHTLGAHRFPEHIVLTDSLQHVGFERVRGPLQSRDVEIYWATKTGSLQEELKKYKDISYWQSLFCDGFCYYDINEGKIATNGLRRIQNDIETKITKGCRMILNLKDQLL